LNRVKAELRQGEILRGGMSRHDYSWDLGKGVGVVCVRCGEPKPPFTQDETPCGDRVVLLVDDLLRTR